MISAIDKEWNCGLASKHNATIERDEPDLRDYDTARFLYEKN